MDASSNLNLPFIIAAQAQKHVTHNEALRALDAVVQLMVLDKDLASPPGSPVEGSRYIVAASPTGAWAGQAGKIAAYQDGAWAFYAPREGWLAWVADEDELYVWSGSAWTAFAGGGIGELVEDTTPELGGPLECNQFAITEVASINGGPLAGLRNVLLNGAMMVASRGTSFTSTSQPPNYDRFYTLDRWLLLTDGNDIVDVTQSTTVPTNGLYSLALDVETVNKKFGICQIVEQANCIGLIGNTVTFSFWAKVSSTTKLDNIKAGIVAFTGTADTPTPLFTTTWGVEGTNPTLGSNWTFENTPANLNVTTSWVRYSVSALVDTASAKNIAVVIWSDVTDTTAGDFLYITDCQLEIGGNATTFERRPYQLEEHLCARYFERLDQGALSIICPITVFTTGFGAGRFEFRPKRTVQWSLCVTGQVGDFHLLDVGGASLDPTMISDQTVFGMPLAAHHNLKSGYVGVGIPASSLVAGQSTLLVNDGVAGSHIEVDNEIRPYIAGENDDYTALLLHGDEPDASTTFRDVSRFRNIVVPIGGAQIDTAQSKFGGSSFLFDGAADALVVAGTQNFVFGTADFTIDFWVRFVSFTNTPILYDARPAGGNGLYPMIYSTNAGVLKYFVNSADRITSGGTLATGTWYHIALARSGTSTKLFVDGSQVGSTYSDSNDYLNGTSGAARPFFGLNANNSASNSLNGWLDEIRVSKGIARWTTTFTPPTAPYR